MLAVQVVRIEELARAKTVRCWFSVSSLASDRALITLQAEGLAGEAGKRLLLFYRCRKYVGLNFPGLLKNYEKRYKVSFNGDFWLAVMELALAMLRELINKIAELGVEEVSEGRFYAALIPIA